MEEIFAGGGYNVLLNFVELIHFYARGRINSHSRLPRRQEISRIRCMQRRVASIVHDIYDQWRLQIDFWGFDSFEGIPVERLDKNNIWEVGEFSREGAPPAELVNHAGVTLVKGWFEDTLTIDCARAVNKESVGIVHFDCDTYSSTMSCWRWLLRNKLVTPGTIVIYDDWGAYKAKKYGEFEIGEAMAHIDIKEFDVQFEDPAGTAYIPIFIS